MESTAGSDWFGMTITHDFSAGGGFKSCPRKMTRKLSKEEIKDKFDGEELDLSLCNLAKVPVREMASLPKATVVDLSCNNLTILPDTFCTLRHLVRLDLSKNALTELPRDFGNLNQLKRLDLYSNQLSFLPLSCVSLKELRWLDLKNNPLQSLWPDVIGNCLSEEECRECAVNMLRHLKVLAANEEQENEVRLSFEREQKAIEEEKEQHQKQLRKRQRQQEKQLKREAYEALERQKKMMAQETDKALKAQEEFMETRPAKQEVQTQEEDGGLIGLLLIFTLLTLGIAMAIVIFCHHDATCHELLSSLSS
ncbi:Leucine rich repeat containing 59 [Desmophyllum pertusum]|uniref:Leucine rich repeat containing 59 n=1 Tax=Desmophyllum pertusum TaxID=174260 RepID=A0A9W9ZQ96_9CNID|nr:Leucine rich repeat containing 59 [Desmophyllum pertusum]